MSALPPCPFKVGDFVRDRFVFNHTKYGIVTKTEATEVHGDKFHMIHIEAFAPKKKGGFTTVLIRHHYVEHVPLTQIKAMRTKLQNQMDNISTLLRVLDERIAG
jgi:hypothetical protein